MSVGGSINGDLVISGKAICQTVQPANPSIGRAAMTDCPQKASYAQAPGTAIVAATQDLCLIGGATATLIRFGAAITGLVATGADRTVNVDLQKSTGAGAFATVLSATLLFNNVSTLRQYAYATLSGTGLVIGDILRVVVTVAGAAGNQAQGLVATCDFTEVP